MLQEWTIQARTDHCDVTEQPFGAGEFFYTLLYRDRDDTLSRRDVSAEGWRQLKADKKLPRPFSFWRSKFAPPLAKEPEALPKADVETRLRRFLTENRPEHARAAYILALMLERKRVLRPTDAQQDVESGRRLLFYEHAGTGETFVVIDPGLKLDQLEEVQREVGELLKNPDAAPSPVSESAAVAKTQEVDGVLRTAFVPAAATAASNTIEYNRRLRRVAKECRSENAIHPRSLALAISTTGTHRDLTTGRFRGKLSAS